MAGEKGQPMTDTRETYAETVTEPPQNVCPTCGYPASGTMCGGCGANLSYVRLIPAADWARQQQATAEANAAELTAPEVMVATTNELPGYRVTDAYGEVFGLTARARSVFANFGAGLRTVVGGEARSYTKLLADSRVEAVDRLRLAAAELGANAVLAMRFDANEIHDVISEIVAYGTAVRVERC
jgi:uncharacterized protein YbjQ (UPF0145 family)